MKPSYLALATFLGVIAVPSAARAWCRATTNQDFWPTAAEPCDTQGTPLAWPTSCVGYSMQKDGSVAQGIDLATATAVAHASFSEWSAHPCFADPNACSGAQTSPPSISGDDLGPVACGNVESNDNGGNANVIVFRDANWPYPDADVTYALTTVQFYTTGEIVGADMEINSDPSLDHFTTSDTVVADDLQSIMTHEAGHFYGLAHTQPAHTDATMYAQYRQSSTEMRTLSDDDVCGICAAYPPTRTAACDPTPRNGFSSICGGGDVGQSKGCSCELPPSEGAPMLAPFGIGSAIAVAAIARSRHRGRALSRRRS